MQRYNATSCTSAIGGSSARDTARADSSSLPPNYSVNTRRQSQLTAYKLKCDKELLNSRLGPPDFHPQSQNCPEETLTRENVQHGYKDTIDGIEDNKEISCTHVQTFTKPVVLKCRDAIRKCLRAINESRAQKRKAGQVYGLPLSGSLLSKSGVFPEQRPFGEDFKKKWIEGLSQQHKRLRSLADHVPHGYRKKTLFEVLIRNNVPLLRATWFIKVTYLNQRPGSSGAVDKSQLSRTELWTKDVIEYLQFLLDEFFTRNHSHSNPQSRDRPPQMLYAGSLQPKNDPTSAVFDGEEPSLHFKWWYVVRLLQWHYAEGLLLPSPIIDWVLRQLQEKELLEILQLLLPIIHGVLEAITLSQTYVRALVGVAIRFIREPSPGGSDLVDNSRRAYTISALIEMLRYLIQAAPDTFVAIDCFPLPPCVISHASNDGSFVSKASEDVGKTKNNLAEVAYVLRSNGIDSQYQSLSLDHLVSTIQKCADNLAKEASSGYPSQGVARAVQALDKSLLNGDLRGAYKCIFEDLCDGDVDEGWVSEISPCLRSSLKWIGTVSPSFICSVFFLCEWATCDFRDFRTGPPSDLKFTGKKDFSQVYVAIQLLKLKMRELQNPSSWKNERSLAVKNLAKNNNRQNNYSGSTFVENDYEAKSKTKSMDGRTSSADIFESPGPLHDIVVCWIDQHEGQKEKSSMRLQLFVLELIHSGIFFPQAYVRQLIVSGIMDTTGSPADLDRRKRHYHILKQLPGMFMLNALEEARVAEGTELSEVVHVYSNECRFVLHQLRHDQYNLRDVLVPASKQKRHSNTGKDCSSQTSGDQWKAVQPLSNALSPMKVKRGMDLEELKASILVLLQLPSTASTSVDTGVDESQGCSKRPTGSIYKKLDLVEGTPGCEDCKRAKRQKLSEEKGTSLQVPSPIPSDEEDTWWVRKGPKSLESFKVDPPLKSTKQVSRGRQKTVRKTQSLAQIAAGRIEGSQGASTSHICDNKTNCPHHRTEVDTPKSLNGIRTVCDGDVVSIGRAIKQLRFVEKRNLTVWLISAVRQLVEETEKTVAKVGQYGRPFVAADEKSPLRWKLGEDELSIILYLLDVSNDLASAVKFLLWLVPKVLNNSSPTMHSGRSFLLMHRNMENHTCEVGESFLLSSLRRYESIVISTDLIPEVLSAMMNRAAAVVASTGRISSSATIIYARHLLKRYGSMASVIAWEKNVKAKYDKRLLSELEAGRSLDGEFGFPSGVLAGVEDPDDYFRQKITSGRISRVGLSMRDVVPRHLDEAFQYYFGKERKLLATGTAKGPASEKWDDVYQIAQPIIMGLMECMRQTGGAAQEGDPSLVSSAVSAIVNNVGPCIAKISDFAAGSNYANHQSSGSLLNFARRILRIHLTCLCLLKDALGERQSRVFEIALATESSSALAAVLGPGKSSRNQFQPSSEAHDSSTTIPNEILNSSAKAAVGRTTKVAAAVSALVIGAVIHGVSNLERMVSVLRLKEGLDIVQFVRSTKTNSNGNARSVGTFKVETSVEVYVHWFRLLVGNCRTVCDGLVAELVGEPSVVALSRMQRMLPINLVFPPAYAIFAFVIWKPFILSNNFAGREDIHQLYKCLTMAIGDAIKHLPFRDVCLRDSKGFYNIVAADSTDAEFAALLELNGLDMHLKTLAFVPLRARLFLNALIDCKMPNHSFQDDGTRASGLSEPKASHKESNPKLLDKLVHVLDTLQPAKFHWQWVELRLLLNEQALLEKTENPDVSLVDAVRSSLPSSEKAADFENENNFIEILLTRLLVRPDAALLYSEVVHLFGRSLEDSVLMQAKWFLQGQDVLFGRKTVRQRLINIAESKGLSTKPQFQRPWGWSYSNSNPATNRGKKKYEATSLEEREVVQERMESKRHVKGSHQMDAEGYNVTQQQVTEKAFVELVLPCIDQSSDDSRSTFASELIKQLNAIEQQISSVMRGLNKQTGTTSSGIEGSGGKGNNRKGIRGGSPGLARRQVGAADSAPPSPAALRASMSLRLHFLVRLLPIICADGEPSVRSMRHMLASVILRLLGSRVVYEDVDLYFNPTPLKEGELIMESSAASAGESLFDRFLLVLHGLLSSCQPIWLRLTPATKSTSDFSKGFSGFDPDMAENLQSDLDRMQLPEMIRWRIQAAMPKLFPSVHYCISCQPSSVPVAAISLLQPSISAGFCSGPLISPQRPVPLARTTNSVAGKSKPTPLSQDCDTEIDPWTLLEDGAGSGPSSSNSAVLASSDHANFRACSWLKGTVRVRRTDLTYIGAIDDDS
ncbi:hypothetical protein SLEP1_g10039 [Rubroshorea leprosula]|uniref:Mediator complex subunit Med12 domain-containing protein n=1 Tax=Rubroshorea leprosula TaxID=152421 RepID=A0AAV5IBD1_9ROSI|nr:hypothetical protein SLEP1_g10039 [Rubroshorea leprosula]